MSWVGLYFSVSGFLQYVHGGEYLWDQWMHDGLLPWNQQPVFPWVHISNFYRPHTKYEGRYCFHRCLFTFRGGGVPHSRSRWGVPHPRSRLRGGRYASCVHAGGLSCSFVVSLVYILVFISVSPDEDITLFWDLNTSERVNETTCAKWHRKRVSFGLESWRGN